MQPFLLFHFRALRRRLREVLHFCFLLFCLFFKQLKICLLILPDPTPASQTTVKASQLAAWCMSLPPHRVFVSVTPRASVAATSGLKLYKVYKHVNIQREAPCDCTRQAVFFSFFLFFIHAAFFFFYLFPCAPPDTGHTGHFMQTLRCWQTG